MTTTIFFKPVIVCIVGPSGAGKTTMAKFIEHALGVPMLVSYTTRPQRLGERQGVDHYFVQESDMPSRDMMLAYTNFGGYHYWTLKDDVIYSNPGVCTYVIDEKGLIELVEKYGDDFVIKSVLITRPRINLVNQVGEERVNRDLDRITIPEREYREVIVNDGTIEAFLAESVKRIRKYIP